jgi:hypothetical protein
MTEKNLLRLSIIVDEIINYNFLHKYNKKEINKIINSSRYKLDEHELNYVLLKIFKKLNNQKEVIHLQENLNNYL